MWSDQDEFEDVDWDEVERNALLQRQNTTRDTLVRTHHLEVDMGMQGPGAVPQEMQARPAIEQLTPKRQYTREAGRLPSPSIPGNHIQSIPGEASRSQISAQGMEASTSVMLGAPCSQTSTHQAEVAVPFGQPETGRPSVAHAVSDPPCSGQTFGMACEGSPELISKSGCVSGGHISTRGVGLEGAAQQASLRGCITIQDVRERVILFRQEATRLPPPGPKHERCPGVFKQANWQACGNELRQAGRDYVVNGQHLTAFYWYCEKCDYREYVQERLLQPRLSLEVVGQDTFKVEGAPGAESCITSCGGLSCILVALGLASNGLCQGPPQQLVSEPALGRVGQCWLAPDSTAVSYPLPMYEKVVSVLSNRNWHRLELLGPGSLVPAPTLAAFRRPLTTRVPADESVSRYLLAPGYLREALLPFQQEGVHFGLQHGGRVLIADEMGVGKTLQAITLLMCYQDEWPALVIAPASLRLIWAEELEKWLPGHIRPSAVHVIEGKADRLGPGSTSHQIVITSYEMHQRLTCDACRGGTKPTAKCAGPENCMVARNWKVVVADESHMLRTSERAPDAKHTEAAARVIAKSRRAILLTGTPSLNRPFDLYRQVDAIRPGLLSTCRQQFSIRYCNRHLAPTPGRNRGGASVPGMRYIHSGLSHGQELHALLKQEVMLRRLKKDVARQLPVKRRQIVRLPRPRIEDWPPTLGSKRPNEDEDKGEDEHEGSSGSEEEEEAATEAKMLSPSHRTGLAKLPSVVDWLAHALGRCAGREASASPDETVTKFLIFAHHRDVMSRLAEALEGEGPGSEWGGAPYVRIDGASDGHDRRLAVTRFRDDPDIHVALLSVTAAGTGLDFSKASVVVFVELPHEVASVRQAEDRAHRYGQQNPVNVYFLISRGTTDERRWQQLNKSLERVSAVHDGELDMDGNGDGLGIVVEGVHDMDQARMGLTQLAPSARRQAKQQPQATTLYVPHPVQDAGKELPAELGQVVDALSDKHCYPEEVVLSDDDCTERKAGTYGASAEVSPTSTTCNGANLGATTPDVLMTGGGREASLDLPEINPGLKESNCQLACPQTSSSQEPAGHDLPGPGMADIVSEQDGNFPAGDDDQPKVWFEVSQHTNRVHIHLSDDGQQPLGLSVPLELLTLSASGSALPSSLGEVLDAVESGPPFKVQSGTLGVLALPTRLKRSTMANILRLAQDFAAEWIELRAVVRSKLVNRCLSLPLQEHADRVEADAVAGAAYGSSKLRYRDPSNAGIAVPEGASWKTVRVHFPRWQRMRDYQQAFIGNTQRLCILCAASVPSCELPVETLLVGTTQLFCGAECENRYSIQSNGGALRRGLFQLERGVCQLCRLDCHALIQSIRVIERGSHRWRERRLQKLISLARKFGAKGYRASAERLASHALDGNAWHADHIVPVYKGGGLCDLDNLRTLCVACHQDVTKEQARERANSRSDERQATITQFMTRPGNEKTDHEAHQPRQQTWTGLSLKKRAALARGKP